MTTRRISQSIVAVAILAASLASAGGAMAWSGCPSYVTVQSGDTLNGMAMACGTTAAAIQAANPGLGWQLYAGQVLNIPGGSSSAAPAYFHPPTIGGTYVVRWGDTLGEIAVRVGVTLSNLVAVNPQIWNANLIFPGQVINLPASAVSAPPTYCPCPQYPPTYYPPTSPRPVLDYSQFRGLKVIYGRGLLVRTGPARSYGEIVSPLVSAVKGSTWLYRKGSVSVDTAGFVWVEVALSHVTDGYSTGWIIVKDALGNYYTKPNIDP
jgi:LysM repeat protein